MIVVDEGAEEKGQGLVDGGDVERGGCRREGLQCRGVPRGEEVGDGLVGDRWRIWWIGVFEDQSCYFRHQALALGGSDVLQTWEGIVITITAAAAAPKIHPLLREDTHELPVLNRDPAPTYPIISRRNRAQKTEEKLRPIALRLRPVLHTLHPCQLHAFRKVADDQLEAVLHADEPVDSPFPFIRREGAHVVPAGVIAAGRTAVSGVWGEDVVLGVEGAEGGFRSGFAVEVEEAERLEGCVGVEVAGEHMEVWVGALVGGWRFGGRGRAPEELLAAGISVGCEIVGDVTGDVLLGEFMFVWKCVSIFWRWVFADDFASKVHGVFGLEG